MEADRCMYFWHVLIVVYWYLTFFQSIQHFRRSRSCFIIVTQRLVLAMSFFDHVDGVRCAADKVLASSWIGFFRNEAVQGKCLLEDCEAKIFSYVYRTRGIPWSHSVNFINRLVASFATLLLSIR